VRGCETRRETSTPHPTPLPMGEGADRAGGTSIRMKRREFITLIVSAAAAWPRAARAQRAREMRRICMLMAWAESDPEAQPRVAAFMAALRERGWIDGQTCRIELRWSAGDIERMQRDAKELIASTPDVILAMTNQMMEVVHKLTRTIPIVFVQVSAPGGAPRWQHDGVHQFRAVNGRKVGRTAQRNRACRRQDGGADGA